MRKFQEFGGEAGKGFSLVCMSIQKQDDLSAIKKPTWFCKTCQEYFERTNSSIIFLACPKHYLAQCMLREEYFLYFFEHFQKQGEGKGKGKKKILLQF